MEGFIAYCLSLSSLSQTLILGSLALLLVMIAWYAFSQAQIEEMENDFFDTSETLRDTPIIVLPDESVLTIEEDGILQGTTTIDLTKANPQLRKLIVKKHGVIINGKPNIEIVIDVEQASDPEEENSSAITGADHVVIKSGCFGGSITCASIHMMPETIVDRNIHAVSATLDEDAVISGHLHVTNFPTFNGSGDRIIIAGELKVGNKVWKPAEGWFVDPDAKRIEGKCDEVIVVPKKPPSSGKIVDFFKFWKYSTRKASLIKKTLVAIVCAALLGAIYYAVETFKQGNLAQIEQHNQIMARQQEEAQIDQVRAILEAKITDATDEFNALMESVNNIGTYKGDKKRELKRLYSNITNKGQELITLYKEKQKLIESDLTRLEDEQELVAKKEREALMTSDNAAVARKNLAEAKKTATEQIITANNTIDQLTAKLMETTRDLGILNSKKQKK
ncbi:hypothetical protein ISS03_03790 [Patescibacteria group bacterium]|nr:hypothetical protein [Patescibacteria group bacterium]